MPRFPTISRRKWTRATAAHLAVRAGFSPRPEEVDRLAALKPEEAVEAVLAPPESSPRDAAPGWFTSDEARHRRPRGLSWREIRDLPEPERRKLQQQFRRQNRDWLQDARAWWLERMVSGPNPVDEKLALFWHGHFATAVQKVNGAFPMLQQNLMFREHGRADWSGLLEAVSADPAMLVYLDNARSNRHKPNENYARELMELFTLGEGHYTEDDVRNAARAFTGWTLDDADWVYRYEERRHDPGHKRFMGESGRFNGTDIVRRIAALPRSAEFLAERMWTFYASDPPNAHAARDVAQAFADGDRRLDAALRAVFLHEDFYHPSVLRGQIKSPVQLLVGLARELGMTTADGKQFSNWCRQLGQELFDPPSVKGWDGGPAWITGSTLALRYDYSAKLLASKSAIRPEFLLPGRAVSREEARDQLFDRFYHSPLREQDRAWFDRVLATLPPPSDWTRAHFQSVLNALVQQPQYQLC